MGHYRRNLTFGKWEVYKKIFPSPSFRESSSSPNIQNLPTLSSPKSFSQLPVLLLHNVPSTIIAVQPRGSLKEAIFVIRPTIRRTSLESSSRRVLVVGYRAVGTGYWSSPPSIVLQPQRQVVNRHCSSIVPLQTCISLNFTSGLRTPARDTSLARELATGKWKEARASSSRLLVASFNSLLLVVLPLLMGYASSFHPALYLKNVQESILKQEVAVAVPTPSCWTVNVFPMCFPLQNSNVQAFLLNVSCCHASQRNRELPSSSQLDVMVAAAAGGIVFTSFTLQVASLHAASCFLQSVGPSLTKLDVLSAAIYLFLFQQRRMWQLSLFS
ncbi:hypothetical protein LR48_Vigan05g127500 [Vigna angularis]|uniref:Uncharacterized protein n=1 Tax=Phaseolus angularis TaxID=3914 RepID=A0A0L9UL90_PHAAN|nr:hypothetical protein LR48_Vigan05g127500 [Vigna angularis]